MIVAAFVAAMVCIVGTFVLLGWLLPPVDRWEWTPERGALDALAQLHGEAQ